MKIKNGFPERSASTFILDWANISMDWHAFGDSSSLPSRNVSHWTYPAAVELQTSSSLSGLGLRLLVKAHSCYRNGRHGAAMSSECVPLTSRCRQKRKYCLNWNQILFSIPSLIVIDSVQKAGTGIECCTVRNLARILRSLTNSNVFFMLLCNTCTTYLYCLTRKSQNIDIRVSVILTENIIWGNAERRLDTERIVISSLRDYQHKYKR